VTQWHVKKNVRKNVGNIVNDETIHDKFMMSFRDLLHSKTEGDFDANLTCLGRHAGLQKDVLGAILEYVNTQWIPHKHHFLMHGVTSIATTITPPPPSMKAHMEH